MDLRAFIRDIPDFPEQGVVFKDITPLLNNPTAFEAAVKLFVERRRADSPGVDRVVGIESRGFIFAAAVSYALGVGLVLARKHGKLPHDTISASYELEYGSAVLEIHRDAIGEGENVLIVDDLLATGGTLAATCEMVERLGGHIASAETLIELEFLSGRQKLGDRPYHAFIKY